MRYYTEINEIDQINPSQQQRLENVTDKFACRVNEYYLSLIDWDDSDDPIRRLIIPDLDELDESGSLDPSNEKAYTIMPGLEHKYRSTALLLVTNSCEGICRYCFRKRVFMGPQKEVIQDLDKIAEYIENRPEITNVLMTGGDPLTLPTEKLEPVIARLRQIDHVNIIRIGTRMTSFNPQRILEDAALTQMISRYSLPDKKIYMMTHFTHPRELTPKAIRAVDCLQRAGAILSNQCPLICGINDDPDTLAELFERIAAMGLPPYYLFQCRPAQGNRAYTVPIEQGYRILEMAKEQLSGLAKRVRYVMSHETGKIEILAVTDDHVYMKYHRAADDSESGRIMVYHANPEACWLDDYNELAEDFQGMESLYNCK